MFKKQFDIIEGGNKSTSRMNMDAGLSKLWIKTSANYGSRLQVRRNIGVYEMTVVERPLIGKLRLEGRKTEVYSSVKVPERRVEDSS